MMKTINQPHEQEPVALKWQQAPVKTQWGDDMVVASVAIDKDHTVDLYCERDQTPKVDAMFALAEQPAQQEPLTDEHIERIYHRYGGDMITCARAIERAAQRTWVGLTDDERGQTINANFGTGLWSMAKDIESKLKAKNSL